MSPHCSGPRPSPCAYRLRAVSLHSGTAGGGHYTAYARACDAWHHFNDSTSRPVNASVLSHSGTRTAAYILVYVRAAPPASHL